MAWGYVLRRRRRPADSLGGAVRQALGRCFCGRRGDAFSMREVRWLRGGKRLRKRVVGYIAEDSRTR